MDTIFPQFNAQRKWRNNLLLQKHLDGGETGLLVHALHHFLLVQTT